MSGFRSWREMLLVEMREHGECFDDIISNTLSDEQMDFRFHCGYGGTRGGPFTAWTTNRVYFPVQYDGSEWVGSVARNPDGMPTGHMGGG